MHRDEEYGFGSLLRALLAREEKTQQELANHLGMRRQAVSDWVCGNHLPRHRDKISQTAEFLNASEEETQQLLSAAIMPRLQPERTEATPEDERTLIELEHDYLQRVKAWAAQTILIWGATGNLARGYVHSRLDELGQPGTSNSRHPMNDDTWNSKQESLYAERLLHEEKMRAAIVAPAGSGKSILWRHLTGHLAAGVVGEVIPLPIDLYQTDVQEARDMGCLLEAAVTNVWPQCSEERKKRLASHFEEGLAQGTVAILIDNWDGFQQLPDRLVTQLRRLLGEWHRVFIFGRCKPASRDVQVQSFVLTNLNDSEVRRFVRGWSLITSHPLDAEAVITRILLSKEMRILTGSPMFLDLICAESVEQPIQQCNRWHLVDQALEHLTQTDTKDEADAKLFRGMLARLAWQGCLRQPPYSTTFDATEVYKLWYGELEEKGEAFYKLAYTRGLLRQASGERLAFSHPVLQAALAAEGWLGESDKNPGWLDYLGRFKSQPPQADTIVFAAAKLGQNSEDTLLKESGAFAKLAQFLDCLCMPNGSDILGLNWLLAGRCLAEVGESTRERLERIGIGKRIRKQLVNWLKHPTCYLMYCEVCDLLSRLRTDALVSDLAGILQEQQGNTNYAEEIKMLGELGGKVATDVLSGIALDESVAWHTRAQAVGALGRTGEAEAIQALAQLLESEDARLGEVAVDALAVHNSPAAATELLRRKNDGLFVGDAIQKLSNPELLPILVRAIPATVEPAGAQETKIDFSLLSAIANIGGDSAVEILAPFLKHPRRDVSDRAAKLLGGMQTRLASQALLEFAENSQQPQSRQYMALASLPEGHGLWDTSRVVDLLLQTDLIPQVPGNEGAQVLREWLFDIPGATVAGAMEALGRTLDADAFSQLRSAVNTSPDEDSRRRIAMVLAHMQRREAIPLLLELAQDPDHRVRDEAIYGLGMLRERTATDLAVTELERALDNDWLVDQLCVALGEIGDERAVPALVRALQENPFVTKWVVQALGKIGGTRAINVLVDRWQRWFKEDTKRSERKDILEALAQSGEPLAVQALIDSTTRANVDWPERDCRGCLSNVHNPDAVSVLVEALSHPVADVREYAAMALGCIGDESAIPRLITLMEDENEWVRDAVVQSIARGFQVIQQPNVVEALGKALDSPNANARRIGLVGLGKVPEGLVSDEILEMIQGIAANESSNFDPLHLAVQALEAVGGTRVVPFLCDLLSRCDQPYASPIVAALCRAGAPQVVPVVLKTASSSLWFHLARPEFLCKLIENRPQSDSVLCRLSFCYNIRVMPDSSVVLFDGRQVACEEAVRWLGN